MNLKLMMPVITNAVKNMTPQDYENAKKSMVALMESEDARRGL